MLPGQLIGDFHAQAVRLAEGLGVPWVRITPRPAGLGFIRVDLVSAEPLEGLVDFPGALRSVRDQILIGRTEAGPDLSTSLVTCGHIAVQGATRLGKSSWCYSALGQLAACRDVEVVGSDPSGLLLKPWATRPGARVALGLADVKRHAEVLDELVSEMDLRIATLPAGVDQVEISEGQPLVLVVLEEFAGLIRAARSSGPGKAHEGIQRSVGRLASEGHKAGYRLLTVSQRLDADIFGGGAVRSQYGLRISFGSDADALKMVHPDVSPDQVAEHATALPGIALVSGFGLPLERIRGPYIGGRYRQYCEIVGSHGVSSDRPTG
jgi:S-DNA-T family DNA segregation ATPase FtsK/SpoIIIE